VNIENVDALGSSLETETVVKAVMVGNAVLDASSCVLVSELLVVKIDACVVSGVMDNVGDGSGTPRVEEAEYDVSSCL
jgi:hypothetical protein